MDDRTRDAIIGLGTSELGREYVDVGYSGLGSVPIRTLSIPQRERPYGVPLVLESVNDRVLMAVGVPDAEVLFRVAKSVAVMRVLTRRDNGQH